MKSNGFPIDSDGFGSMLDQVRAVFNCLGTSWNNLQHCRAIWEQFGNMFGTIWEQVGTNIHNYRPCFQNNERKSNR